MTTLTIPRHSTPPSTLIAHRIARTLGVPVSWATDLPADTITLDLPGVDDEQARAAWEAAKVADVEWVVTP